MATDAGRETEVEHLRSENERIFREAQLAADAVFAHYQLSQILASHESTDALADAILDELIHLCGADRGLLWVHEARTERLVLAAHRGALAEPDELDAGSWTSVGLDDGSRRVGLVALSHDGTPDLEAGGVQLLRQVRHELAVALRGARLRESLDLERAELGAIFEGASDAIMLVDEGRRVVRINAAAGALLGQSPEATVGRLCEEVLGCRLGPSQSEPCRQGCPFAAVIESGEAVSGVERTIGSANADPVTVVGNYTLASRSAGGGAMTVAVFRDTSLMAQIQELRRGFIGTVSHELRTPLALIKGYVDTLLHLDLDAATARQYLQRIDQTTERLTELVRQTLDVTQLAVGRLVLERSPVLLSDIVRAAIDDLGREHPDIAVEVSLDGSLPPVEADPARIGQVMDNLLANAVKYGPAGGRVRVTARASGDSAEVVVEDDGVGVPADERELVFQQFHRGRNVRESTLPGYGLGLSISRRIVEAHGGQLTIQPDRTAGTALVMRLPLAREPRLV